MLVVVYLIAAKKYIIIPQEWIMSLTQESLNNIGKASYQNRRIFWSNVRVNSDGIPDSSIVADFRRNVSVTFPPNTDAACYIARVKCFCATLDRAKYFRDTFRPQIPVLYNVRKQFKVQLPSVLLNNQNTNNSHSLIDRRPNGIPVEDEPETQAEPIAGPSVDHDISLNENSNEFQEEQESESSVGSYVADEEKCVMPIIELNETDSMAISNVFDEEQMDGAQDNDTEYEVPVLASTATTFQDGGVLKVKRVYADDCEMIYPLGVKLMPRDPLYQVKVNDPISLHIPYKENAKGDRAYLLMTKNGPKEVSLAAKIVNGLTQVNDAEKRENASFDKAFIKALLVGLVGISGIKSQGVDKNVMRFIKELFQIRVGEENQNRYATFDQLIHSAIEEIKHNVFKSK